MNILSKIDVRMEAVRIAIQLKDATTENVIRIAKEIETYILSKAELPEAGTDYYQSLLNSFSANIGKHNEDMTLGLQALSTNKETQP